jgi:hypothetical protein
MLIIDFRAGVKLRLVRKMWDDILKNSKEHRKCFVCHQKASDKELDSISKTVCFVFWRMPRIWINDGTGDHRLTVSSETLRKRLMETLRAISSIGRPFLTECKACCLRRRSATA